MELVDRIFQSDFRFFANTLPLSNLQSVFGAVAIYLVVIYSLQKWMKDRKRFELGWIVPLHNFFLSGLSLLMLVGVVNEIKSIFLRTQSAEVLFCDTHKDLAIGRQVGWFYIFFLSKFYELFDTVIIVLKKRPIIFLHVYHHCITILLTFVMLDNEVAVQWIPITANAAVHVPMYFYYGLSALGIDVWWKKYITLFQITQFVADLLANSVGFVYHYLGYPCSGSLESWIFGQSVLLSFLVLFLFFYQSTYKKKQKST